MEEARSSQHLNYDELIGKLAEYRALFKDLYSGSEHYRAIVASSDDAIIGKDLNGNITSWNKSAEKIFGYTREEVIGRSVKMLIPDELHGEEDEIQEKVRNGERIDHYETRRRRKDGRVIDISLTLSPIKNELGQVIGASKVARDISGDLRNSAIQSRLSAIVESSDDAIVSKDLNGIVTSWNKGAERIFGYSADEMIGQSILKLIPQEYHHEEQDILERLRSGQRIDHFETIRAHKNGRRINVSITVSPIRDQRNRIVGASKVARDVTEQRRAMDQLRESEEKFTTIFNSSPIGAVLTDESYSIVLDANPAFLRLCGRSLEELKARPALMTEMFHEEKERERLGEHLRREGQLIDEEVRLAHPTGRVKDVLINGRFVVIGGARHLLMHVEDITDRKAAVAALKEADRRKDEFLATLAHELRSPLAPLSNALQLMEMAADDPVLAAQAREMMDRQLRHMVHLVDDLMDVSRVSRGVIELRRSTVDLREILAASVEATRPLMDQQKHHLEVKLVNEPLWLEGDSTRLTQIFNNLLNNAAKYTDPGGVITLESTVKNGHVLVSVTDTGIGIEPDKLDRVFDMFSQLESALTRKHGGLGIGLSIVKQLVQMHGGTIKVDSLGRDHGSTFTVKLPLTAAPLTSTETGQPAAANGRKLRIIVTDDNEESAISLALMLNKLGHEAHPLHSGNTTISGLQIARPHVIFMDIGMPGMDGYETCRRIRSMPNGSDIYMVALTGWGQVADKEQAEAAGFDRHLVKPITRDAILEVLNTVDEKRSIA